MNDKESSLISFKGSLSPEKCSEIIESCEGGVFGIEQNRAVAKRVVWILIEILQNLSLHSDANGTGPLNGDENAVEVALGYTEHFFTLTSRNYVTKERASQLRKVLDKIKDLSRDELHKLSMDRLLSGNSLDRSARIGLIEIARRSNNKLKYDLTKCGQDLYCFHLRARIER
jgi:hypothetical protein